MKRAVFLSAKEKDSPRMGEIGSATAGSAMLEHGRIKTEIAIKPIH